jgi:hypothetical protein
LQARAQSGRRGSQDGGRSGQRHSSLDLISGCGAEPFRESQQGKNTNALAGDIAGAGDANDRDPHPQGVTRRYRAIIRERIQQQVNVAMILVELERSSRIDKEKLIC